MKKFFLFILTMSLVVACYDDSALTGRVDNLENRVGLLEEQCRKMNTNISSLQTIVTALQNNDFVTDVASVMEAGEEVGYTITFSKSGPITVYHGKDGKDGVNGENGKDGADGKDGVNGTDGKDGLTPVIGVRKDTDGIYYWTLNGEWLLDDNGNKIKAVGTDGADGKDGIDGLPGTDGKDGEDGVDGLPGADGADGKDGITPQLKIVDGYWQISYDNGASWTQLGKATGEDGNDGADGQPGTDGKDGDSMFKSVTHDEDNVYLTLADGTVLTLPKSKDAFSISFSDLEVGMLAGGTVTIEYTITGDVGNTLVKAVAQNGWKAKVTMLSDKTGEIAVTAPDPLVEDEIIVLAYDGNEKTIMHTLNFVTGVISSSLKTKDMAKEGGTFTVDVTTNMKYEVNIPESAKSWLGLVETKAVRTDVLTFSCSANQGPQRSAVVTLLTENGDEAMRFSVFQWGEMVEVEDLSASATANCYIVSKFGYYKFKAVKGNSSESVGVMTDVEVLWESFGTSVAPDKGDLITEVSHADNYITFATPETFKEGNAVISAKAADGKVLWSWHIWLTDQPEDQVYNNNAGTMMDRNLGATSATPGDVGALGLLYQWGRKDPFLGSSSISSNTTAASTITWPSSVPSDASRGTIAYATEHPTTFIRYNSNNSNNYDWYYTGDYTTDDTLWQSAKTIYDPCPAGYRVPDGGSDGVWGTAFGNVGYYPEWDKNNIGYNFGGTTGSISYLTSDSCWYPAGGYLGSDAGSLYRVGTVGHYWSCSPSGKYAYYLNLYVTGNVNPSRSDGRADGYSVRCLREE